MAATTDQILEEVQALTKQLKALLSDFQKSMGILDVLVKAEKKRAEEAEKKRRGGEG